MKQYRNPLWDSQFRRKSDKVLEEDIWVFQEPIVKLLLTLTLIGIDMSKLLERIRADQIAARRAKNTFNATALTTLLGEASPSGNETVTDEQVTKVVQKFLKNLKELIGYTDDLEVQVAARNEIALLEKYQPQQLTEDQLRAFISHTVAGLDNVPEPKRVGMVMKALTTNHKGQYDGKIASAIVKEMV